jgi:glutamine transport system substrate-binding protein
LKKWIKMLAVGMLITGLLVTVIGCKGEQQKAGDSTPKQKLVVGTEATFPPFEMIKDGEYTGFDMEIIRAIGESQGYDVEIKNLGFDALIPAVQSGNIDCVIAAVSIDEERAKKVDFSQPYFDAGLIIAVKQETTGITTTKDLQGKKVAAQVGTTGAEACRQIKDKDAGTDIRYFDSVGEAFMELEKGGVDAVINDLPVTLDYIQTTGKDSVKMVGDVFNTDEQYGIAVKKGNSKLLDDINKGLDEIKASGQYDQIYGKWFK